MHYNFLLLLNTHNIYETRALTILTHQILGEREQINNRLE